MSQRVILAAQANAKFPNFAGFCFGWDTTGYAIGGRRGLLTYWGWGNKTEALRNYIARIDKHTQEEFKRRTGMAAVSEAELAAFLAPKVPRYKMPKRFFFWEALPKSGYGKVPKRMVRDELEARGLLADIAKATGT